MRNSPFQLKQSSVHETIESNLSYQRHRKIVNELGVLQSPRDYKSEMRNKNQSLQRTRRFENQHKHQEEEKCNLRLLNKFVDIQRGKHLSVGRADYQTVMTRSPVQKNHSLSYDKKKIDDIQLFKSNIQMLKRIQKVESHTKFDDHQSQWTEK